MAGISSFTLSWWYSSNTKLAIRFQTTGASIGGSSFALPNSGLGIAKFLDSTNGLSASVEEDYRLQSIITDHPVETGVAISDHIIPMPKVFTITGLLTAIDTLQIAGFNTGEGILNFNQLGQAIQFLFNAYDSRTLFSLTTGLYYGRGFFTAQNLAIQSISIPRNNEYGRTSIRFSITFKEMILTDPYPQKQSSQSSTGSPDPNITGPTI